MSRLVVGSVIRNGHEQWYPLQRAFLRATTKDYQMVITSRGPLSCLVGDERWVQADGRMHAHGISALGRAFQATDCEYCLLLDSDAFPVNRDWLDILVERMRINKKIYSAVVRTENMDHFPHVSFMLFQRRHCRRIMQLAAKRGDGTKAYLGSHEIGSDLPMHNCFPLLKSNHVSIDPLWHTIYYDVAYHCGSGSRPGRGMRGELYWDIECVGRNGYTEIAPRPAAFINNLLGQDRFTEDELAPQ